MAPSRSSKGSSSGGEPRGEGGLQARFSERVCDRGLNLAADRWKSEATAIDKCEPMPKILRGRRGGADLERSIWRSRAVRSPLHPALRKACGLMARGVRAFSLLPQAHARAYAIPAGASVQLRRPWLCGFCERGAGRGDAGCGSMSPCAAVGIDERLTGPRTSCSRSPPSSPREIRW